MSGNLGLALYHYHSIHYHLACHNALTSSSTPLTLSHTPAGLTAAQPPPSPTTNPAGIAKQLRSVWRYAAAAIWSERRTIELFAHLVFGFPLVLVGALYVSRLLFRWLLPDPGEHTCC